MLFSFRYISLLDRLIEYQRKQDGDAPRDEVTSRCVQSAVEPPRSLVAASSTSSSTSSFDEDDDVDSNYSDEDDNES